MTTMKYQHTQAAKLERLMYEKRQKEKEAFVRKMIEKGWTCWISSSGGVFGYKKAKI